MSKNQKTSLLLLAVVLTWGAVGFQIYSRYYPEIPELQSPLPKICGGKYKQWGKLYHSTAKRSISGRCIKNPGQKSKKVPKPTVLFVNLLSWGHR